MSSMIERAERIGGSLSIQSEPNAGTELSIIVLLNERQTPIFDELESK